MAAVIRGREGAAIGGGVATMAVVGGEGDGVSYLGRLPTGAAH